MATLSACAGLRLTLLTREPRPRVTVAFALRADPAVSLYAPLVIFLGLHEEGVLISNRRKKRPAYDDQQRFF